MQKEADNKNIKAAEQAANAAKELNETELNDVAGGGAISAYRCANDKCYYSCLPGKNTKTCPKCGSKLIMSAVARK